MNSAARNPDADHKLRDLRNRSDKVLVGLRLVSLVLAFSACGCHLHDWVHNGFKVGPEYCPPGAPVAGDWIDGVDPRVQYAPPPTPAWWTVLNDPILNQLIETAYQQNLSLREAGWRVMQARAQRDIAVGSLFPQSQQGFGEYSRILESENVAVPAPLRSFDQWSTGMSVAWELDVWGRFRRAVAAADANVEFAFGDYDAILICLIAEVASAYTDYRTNQLRLEYARQNVEIQEKSLGLTQHKADEGATSYTGVHLAKSSLESTRSGIPTLEIAVRQANNRLCTLLGVPPHDLLPMLGVGDIPTSPPEVAVGIPAELLRRRPDVRAAERAVAAQSEQIGIATADLYPHFSLNGEFAYQAEEFSDLFASASGAGFVGPAFSWDILNYGRLVNNVRFQEAGLQELILSYQNTVLTANQEVEDALIAFLRNQERVASLEKSVTETEEALKLLTISFEEDEISFTGVFVMQGELVLRQDDLAQARGDVVTSLIDVYKALGGGWEVRSYGFPPPHVTHPVNEMHEPVPAPEADHPPPRLPVPPPAARLMREGVSPVIEQASGPVASGISASRRDGESVVPVSGSAKE